MGLEITQQALPGDWDLLERARSTAVGELVQFVPSWLARAPAVRSDDDDDRRSTYAACAALVAREPDIATLRVDLDRSWDLVHHLLSPQRRRGGPRDDGAIAVRGDVALGAATATQGAPVMWTAPAVVARVHASLAAADETARVRDAFDPVALEAAGTYKLFAGRDDEAALAHALELIAHMRRVYAAATARGWGVLVVLD